VAFSYPDFHTTLYFLKQRNYKTLKMQAHALTRTHYFYSLNVIISHPIVYQEGVGFLSICSIASWSSPPSHMFVMVIQAWSYVAATVMEWTGGVHLFFFLMLVIWKQNYSSIMRNKLLEKTNSN
jgi:hypothetical protein